MKKLCITLLLAVVCAVSFAQLPVDTTVQKRNVVLEEFTGLHCGFCPDGHSVANSLVSDYPGRVFLVNVHAGGFAVPQDGEPELRTNNGDDIDAQAAVSGYPSGSVSRSTSPWGKGRDKWENLAEGLLSQNSPVNVAIQASVDVITRKLTTEVEIYYTANSIASTNKLTVVLLQNDILGYQSDYGNFNPENWVGGKYRHNHVLRMMISGDGTWGETIDTTTKGYRLYKKYVTDIPENILYVDGSDTSVSPPIELHRLEVVAFVAQAKGNIYSGAGAKVEFDNNLKTDLSMNNLTENPSDLCQTFINPKIEVTNNMDNEITDFSITMQLEGKEYTKSFSGSLTKGQKTIIDWDTIPFYPTGAYSMEIQGFKDLNGNLLDVDLTNDFLTVEGMGFEHNAFDAMVGGFDNPGIPQNFAFDQTYNSAFGIRYSSTEFYGANYSKACLLFYLHDSWNVANQPASILFGEADLSFFSKPGFAFYYAYSDGGYGGTAPKIKLEVSENCGVSWNEVLNMTATETGSAASGQLYLPSYSEWKIVRVPLVDYKDKSLIFKLSVIPGTTGNSLYIDELILDNMTIGIAENDNENILRLYPNPVSNIAQLQCNLSGVNSASVAVYNSLNQRVYTKNLDKKLQGEQIIPLDFSALSSGMYFLTVMDGNVISTKKFVIR